MNKSTQFRCQQCGVCCQTKYLCLYASELKRAKYYANLYNKQLELEPLRYILDAKHQKIFVLIYRVDKRPCPFFSEHRCLIHDYKFVACRKYPIRNWIDLGKVFKFLGLKNEFYEVDENCTYIKTHPSFKEAIKTNPLSKLIPDEFRATLEDKKIWLDLNTKFKVLKKEKKLQLIHEHRLKKSNFKRLKEILSNWEKIPANQSLEELE